jgi:hypothetical protein
MSESPPSLNREKARLAAADLPRPPGRDPTRPATRAPPPARRLLARLPGPPEDHAGSSSEPELSPGPQRSHARAVGGAAAPGVAHRGSPLRPLRGARAPGCARPGPRRGGALPAAERRVHARPGPRALARPSRRGRLTIRRIAGRPNPSARCARSSSAACDYT